MVLKGTVGVGAPFVYTDSAGAVGCGGGGCSGERHVTCGAEGVGAVKCDAEYQC